MKCKNLKTKIGNIPYCKIKKKEINYRLDCINCKYYEFDKKHVSYSSLNKKVDNFPKKNKKSLKIDKNRLKSRSSKLAKLERDRESLFTDNKDKCMFCPATTDLTWHEIYAGRNRQNSMRYKLCLRMCINCHEKYQEDKAFNDEWHKKGQEKFIEVHPDLSFIDIFHINYLQ